MLKLLPRLALAVLPLAAETQDAPPAARVVPAVRGALPDPLPRKFTGPPTEPGITPLDLATRVYRFADDSMMGRLAGTPWNDKGTDYIAAELARLGLQPAGENGTYFQPAIVTRELGADASLGVGGRLLGPWTDYAPRDQGPGAKPFAGKPVVFGGIFGDTASDLPPAAAAGKTVVIRVGNGPDGRPSHNIINRFQLTNRYRAAAAIAVIHIDYAPPGYIAENFVSGGPTQKGQSAGPELPAYFYITREVARASFGVDPDSLKTGMEGRPFSGGYRFEDLPAPGRNVIAVLPGSDPALRGQYVAIGAHNDHIGFSREPADHDSVKAFMQVAAPQGADNSPPRPTDAERARIAQLTDSLRKAHGGPRPDSIYNGADDDASGSMGLLEIAEAFATTRARPKRSVLFIWHVGEELGLFGSNYFTENPTVPRDSIVAELNVDMIGRGGAADVTGQTKDGDLLRGGPGYVQLVGARRLSTELGDLVEAANATPALRLRFDYAMDANGHPQNIYCRSDHYEYAKHGIPIVFFTTGGHADYHQVTDEPQYINYANLTQVAKLVHRSALDVANLGHRVVVDKPKPDPRGNCVQ